MGKGDAGMDKPKKQKVLVITGKVKRVRLSWDWLLQQPNANEIYERAKKVANGELK